MLLLICIMLFMTLGTKPYAGYGASPWFHCNITNNG